MAESKTTVTVVPLSGKNYPMYVENSVQDGTHEGEFVEHC